MEQRLIDANRISYHTNYYDPMVAKSEIDLVDTVMILPENPTNGDVMLSINEIANIYGIDHEKNVIKVSMDNFHIQFFDLDWWNAPYREDA